MTSGTGMEVGRLEVMADDKEWMSIQVQLWDFAGQDIYYSTHSFFMSTMGILLGDSCCFLLTGLPILNQVSNADGKGVGLFFCTMKEMDLRSASVALP